MNGSTRTVEVWALLYLCKRDARRIREFFVSEVGVEPGFVVGNLHLTAYHSQRPLPGVKPVSERAHVVLAAEQTRFMVMAPGGENPKPGLVPAKRKVGIRVHRQSEALAAILAYRDRLLQHETKQVLGHRRPSTHRRNAFGARHFQPHITLLRPGSGIDRDLRKIGVRFRDVIGDLTFDRFVVQVIRRTDSRTA